MRVHEVDLSGYLLKDEQGEGMLSLLLRDLDGLTCLRCWSHDCHHIQRARRLGLEPPVTCEQLCAAW